MSSIRKKKNKKKSSFNYEPASSCLIALNSGNDLLKTINDNIPFQEYLNIISNVSSADRTYIFLNHTGASEERLMSNIAEWCRDDIPPQIDDPELQNLSYDRLFQRWYDILSDEEIVSGNVKDFPAEERKFLEKRGIKSLLVSPLISGGEFTGFLGFDNCSSDIEWSETDIEYIRALSNNLSYRIENDWVLSKLKIENTLFSTVMDAMDVVVLALDYETFQVIYMNKYAISEFGDGIGKKCWNVFYEDKTMPCSFCPKKFLIRDDATFNDPHLWEHYYSKIDKWCMVSCQAIQWPDGRTVIFETLSDITKHKKSENLLSKSIDEKDSLLNELHHRVKNNLQSLVYLISMQRDYIDNPKAVEILEELQDRVQAMSLVHSQLYQSKDMANIDFGKYVSDLVDSILRALSRENINTFINISGIHLDIKTAIPCGLIINELVTNIIKHAFKDKKKLNRDPEIHISLENKEDKYILKVGDNGTGFKMHSNLMNTSSLGLKLVTIWATHQLMGTLDINKEQGVEFLISFPHK